MPEILSFEEMEYRYGDFVTDKKSYRVQEELESLSG